ncbi:MAG TPA: hypothetical protein ENF76_05775 [Candidatus Bathyarchaeota archaeon]|nr:MAG: hypothetical protein DRO50_01345 [Candidatus Bathyarchaeota archaeon]HDI07852.1 hypothetical protein [Candidatus Bathyarchaeota archaeon]
MRGKRKAYYASKLKRAAHLLFYRRHKKPGVKGWELRKNLGKDYPKVLKILDDYLERLDLQVKTVFEEERPAGKPTPEQLDKARFFVTLRGTLTAKEAKMVGWRIDDLAGLAVTIAYIISRRGKASRKEVEKLLREKLPKWRADLNLDRYIRYGYIIQDEKEQLYLGWRTQAEVDQKALINLLLGSEETSSVNA